MAKNLSPYAKYAIFFTCGQFCGQFADNFHSSFIGTKKPK